MAGCVQHIGEYEAKRRQYRSPVDFEKLSAPAEPGSLFQPGYTGAYLFADQRAMRIGDIVTIRIREEADAKRGAATELSRNGSANAKIEAFFGLLNTLEGVMDGDELVNTLLSTDFSGAGQTSRTEHLEATVPATVREVLPNGNLFVEGHRVILVNNEEHHFYISGVVRPVDISGDNSVESSLVADAEIEFTGRGVVSEKQSPGWLSRALDWAAPF
jgi:flagellar L-ring protein precursor FlgH